MSADDSSPAEARDGTVNGASWCLSQYGNSILHQYGIPFMHFFISFIYGIYLRVTLFSVAIFVLKYVPTAIYMYSLVKKIYVTSRERLRKKRNDLEDLKLQMEIVKTKLSVRDAEFCERGAVLRRATSRLRRVRRRVRHVLASHATARAALRDAAAWDSDTDTVSQSTPPQDRESIDELLKELNCNKLTFPEKQTEKMDTVERAQSEPGSPENSVYSSLSDVDVRQDCRVKIVKVTNVYKVAYLKHFIKQKRLRRANRQAILRKKMESIKKLLEDWQKTLNMVINSKLPFMSSHPLDLASQEARGDYSKRRESDSDSDLINSSTDVCHDDYSLSWAQNPYKSSYGYSFEDTPTAVSREHSPQDFGDIKYPEYNVHPCDYTVKSPAVLSSIMEEIQDQMVLEEIKSEASEECDCRDFVEI